MVSKLRLPHSRHRNITGQGADALKPGDDIGICADIDAAFLRQRQVDTLFKVNQLMDDFDYFAAAGMA
jgi:hypothetical protein